MPFRAHVTFMVLTVSGRDRKVYNSLGTTSHPKGFVFFAFFPLEGLLYRILIASQREDTQKRHKPAGGQTGPGPGCPGGCVHFHRGFS